MPTYLGQYVMTAGEQAFAKRVDEAIKKAKTIGGFLSTWSPVSETRDLVRGLIPDAKVLLPAEKVPTIVDELEKLNDGIGQWRKGNLSKSDIGERIVSRLNLVRSLLGVVAVKETIVQVVKEQVPVIAQTEAQKDVEAGRTPIVPKKSNTVFYVLGGLGILGLLAIFLKGRKKQ